MQKKIAVLLIIVLLVAASVGLGLYIGLLPDGSDRILLSETVLHTVLRAWQHCRVLMPALAKL